MIMRIFFSRTTSDELADARRTAAAAVEAIPLADEALRSSSLHIGVGEHVNLAAALAQCRDGRARREAVQAPAAVALLRRLRHAAVIERDVAEILRALVRRHLDQDAVALLPRDAQRRGAPP